MTVWVSPKVLSVSNAARMRDVLGIPVVPAAPVNAVWFAVVGAFILGIPSLYQVGSASVAFFAIVSIGTVGLYVAYVIPIFLRLRMKDFEPGPWSLGKWSKPIGFIAVIWVIIITILFFAPAFYPWTTAADINWSGPVFVAVMAVVFIWYGVSARKWFTGPKMQGTKPIYRDREGIRLRHRSRGPARRSLGGRRSPLSQWLRGLRLLPARSVPSDNPRRCPLRRRRVFSDWSPARTTHDP